MQFKDHVPPGILNQYPNVENLVKVLDETNSYKQSLLAATETLGKPVSGNLDYLRQRIEGYGHPTIPDDFPKEILDSLLLNSAEIMRLKGSKLGLRLWLWCLTFSDFSLGIDDSAFYPKPQYIIPGDVDVAGYVSHVTPLEPYNLYLFSGDYQDFGSSTLIIQLPTKYHYMKTLRDYINTHIRKFISFVPENSTTAVVLRPGSYTPFANVNNNYFVI